MTNLKMVLLKYTLGLIVLSNVVYGSTSLVSTSSMAPAMTSELMSSMSASSALMSSMSASSALMSSMSASSALMSSMSSSQQASSMSMQISTSSMTMSSSMMSSSNPATSSMSAQMSSSSMDSFTQTLSSSMPASSSTLMSSSQSTTEMSSSQPTTRMSSTSVMMTSSIMSSQMATSASSASSIMPSSSIEVTPTNEPEPRPGPEPTPEQSAFGQHGFTLFGVTFAIAVILLVILILVICKNKRKSGTYLTGENKRTKKFNDVSHMSFPVNNGGFDNIVTIDLDKDERADAGVTSFSNIDENEKPITNGKPKTEIKAVEPPILTFADAGSTNNLLTETETEKRQSVPGGEPAKRSSRTVDEPEKRSSDVDLAAMIGIKMEPSTGDSVESLEHMKETDKLMLEKDNKSDESEDEEVSDIDDDLPPPDLSGDDQQTEV